ncbi:transposase [Siccirubricoccus deserti]|nr:transposase [Siccirubricoccus deserti]
MSVLFWLSDEQWSAIAPHLPRNRPGVKPRRNREVISGIIHVQRVGCRWRDCPAEYGPHTTIYSRFNRWSKRGVWQALLARLTVFDAAGQQSIDSTTTKAHRCAAGGQGGPKPRPSAAAGAVGPPRSTPSPTSAGG